LIPYPRNGRFAVDDFAAVVAAAAAVAATGTDAITTPVNMIRIMIDW